MLEAAAAHMWSVNANDCRARNHAVVHVPTGRQLSFGDVAKVAATLQVPPADHLELRLKPASERRYVGKPIPIVDLDDMVRGNATYGIDVVLPGMKYASVERCPVYGGKVKSFEAADALKVPGVEQVLEMPAAKIRVIATPNGGGFGGKSDPFNHEIVVCKLAMLTRRPVKIETSRLQRFSSNSR